MEKMTVINPRTQEMFEIEPQQFRYGMVPVFRDTSAADHMREQLALYAPCECGSGKKYKWCCK